jgi:2-methylcitrate dehydratase PrpD
LTTEQTDLCEEFARLVSTTRFEALPPDAVEAARKSLLDTLGVVLAASGLEPAVLPVIAFAREAGERQESTVLGFGDRTSAGMAALANGAMAHCLDFDDRTRWGAHAGSSLVPAVLALAERRRGVSGRRLLAAIAAGQDVFVRLRCNVQWDQDWNLSSVMGTFSAAAAGSYILDLDPRQTASAMGIATLQAGGTMQVIYGGSHLRGMYAGFAANTAVNATLLAEKGLTGMDQAFEGKAGLLAVHFDGQYDRQAMLADLGQDYLGAYMLYKPWPVVGIAHTYIHAVMEAMREHRIATSDIDHIRVHVTEYQHQICDPIERRRSPETPLEAKYSLPYCVALAAIRGRVEISDFTPAALKDADVRALAARVVPVRVEGPGWKSNTPEGRVEVITRDGRTIGRVGDDIPGSLDAPLTWDALARKFRTCAAASVTPVHAEKAEQLIALIKRLETLDDVSELIRAVS